MNLPPLLIPGVLATVMVLAAALWIRRQNRDAQRRSMRAFHTLSEDLIAARSPDEIAEKLADVLPFITQATSVRLYLFNPRTKSLEAVPTDDDPEPMAISTDAPQEGWANALAACFRNRTLLNIPDVRRNPLISPGWTPELPRSALFVPLLAQQDGMGILEAGNRRRLGYFKLEEQEAIQHLANQVAASLKLQEQNRVREQLFRSEKLAATGRLISGVATDLRAPFDSILRLSTALAADHTVPAIERQLKQLAVESHRAQEIVSRLVSFAHPEDVAAGPVDVNALVGGLLQFRRPEWHALGLRVQDRMSPEPAVVLGAQGPIEQVFLTLLVHAEQCAAASVAKSLSIVSSRLAGRVVVEIGYASVEPHAPETDALGLDVCRGVIQSHGGEIRCLTQSGAGGFEVDLPLAPGTDQRMQPHSAVRKPARALSLILVDPDGSAQRQMIGLLTSRGHRVVPVTAEQAPELAHRMRFDGIFWAVRASGAKWSDFEERIRPAIPAFALVCDSYDADLAASLAESGGALLARPIQQSELDVALQSLESRVLPRQLP